MTRHVTIPFPEGLHGDYSSPWDGRTRAACAAESRPTNDAVPDGGLGARAALQSPEASRAFRESLARLGTSPATGSGVAEPTLHTVDFSPIAA